MKEPKKQEHGSYLVSIADLLFIFKKNKSKILWATIACAFVALAYATTRPIEYEASATFREQAKTQSGIGNTTLASFLSLGSSNSNASEALSLMKSRHLLEQLVEKQGLQVSSARKEITFNLLSTVRDNMLVEYAYFQKRQEPILKDKSPLVFHDVDYKGVVNLPLTLVVASDESFKLSFHDDTSVEGRFNEPTAIKNISLTLSKPVEKAVIPGEYNVNIRPIYGVVDEVFKKLTLETDRDDKLLIKLKYACYPREQAVDCLRVLMGLYHDYIKNEQVRVLTDQIGYLHERQEQMQFKLQKMMEEHATTLASDAVTTGFLNSAKAMEFLAENLQRYTQQIIANDLEMKQLARVQEEGPGYYDRLATRDEGAPINQILSKMRSLKQQADSLDLMLREESKDPAAAQVAFGQQIAELEKVQKLSQEAQQMAAGLEKGVLPTSTTVLFNEGKYRIKEWCGKLQSGLAADDKKNCTANFSAYLHNLIHLFEVHAKAIQERLTHQQNDPLEFQGVDLTTAHNLYITYTKQLNDLEASLLQHQFVIEKMQDEAFEITALNTVLTDSVSREMISHAAQAALSLKDQNNRSSKELERLKQELALQKGFLTTHLQQTIALEQIQKQLIEDKIRSLQSATLGLTQQEISVLQEHLGDYIKTRIDNISQEMEVLHQHQRELQQEMARWPSQWVSEMLIEQQMEVNQKMVEEITKLIESKNIASNLEVIRSSPIDFPVTPPLPRSPRLMLYVLIAAFFGAVAAYAWAASKTLAKGVPVTPENLAAADYPVAGSFSDALQHNKPLRDADLEPLRRVAGFLDECGKGSKRFLLLHGNGPDYSRELAALLAKKQQKSIVVPLSFDHANDSKELPGLLQYLEKSAQQPVIAKSADYDKIAAGGISRYANELFSTDRFAQLLAGLEPQYDWVIGVSNATLTQPEAATLLRLFPAAAVTINHETWPELESGLKHCKHVIFVFNEKM